jgi:hypothetical protein
MTPQRHTRSRRPAQAATDRHIIRAVYRQAASDLDGRWTTVELGIEYAVNPGELSADHSVPLARLAGTAQLAVAQARDRVERELELALDRPRYDRVMAQVRHRLAGRPWLVPPSETDKAIEALIHKHPCTSSEAERLFRWLSARARKPLPANWPWRPVETAITVIADDSS